MTQPQISKEDILAVLPTVAATIADALGCDVEDVKPDASLIDDLDAESIDFLDMVFRLERAFKIKIPRGKIVENARGTLTEAEFEQHGLVTEAGMAQLRAYMSEVPAARFSWSACDRSTRRCERWRMSTPRCRCCRARTARLPRRRRSARSSPTSPCGWRARSPPSRRWR